MRIGSSVRSAFYHRCPFKCACLSAVELLAAAVVELRSMEGKFVSLFLFHVSAKSISELRLVAVLLMAPLKWIR
jgi:hypothetical protein